MKKELKDYIHLYLGCECVTPDGVMILNGINTTDMKYSAWFYCRWDDKKNCYLPKQNGEILPKESCIGKSYKYSEIKLVLRHLSDMTEEEKAERDKLLTKGTDGVHLVIILTPNCYSFKYLLDKHFDLFGLIEAGVAIDKTTLNVPH